MTERQAQWSPWLQALISITLAAFAAYGGVQAGQAEIRSKTTELARRIDEQDMQMTRIEDKIDWLVKHELEVSDHLAGRK